MATTVRGRFLHLHLAIDVWSRRIVAWRVHPREGAELAAEMIRSACEEGGVDRASPGETIRADSRLTILDAHLRIDVSGITPVIHD